MKKIIFILALFSITSCTDSFDSGCVSPPKWIQGTWQHTNNKTQFTRFESNEIVNIENTNTGSFSIGVCETLDIVLSTEITAQERSENHYTYGIGFGNNVLDYYTYFKIDENTIGFCRELYPCTGSYTLTKYK